MPTEVPSAPSPRPARTRARRVALLAALVASTVALGAAARWSRPAAGVDPAPHPTPTPVTSASGAGPVQLSARLDRSSVLRGGDGRLRAELVITAVEDDRPLASVPTDLVVVLDRSGSMQGQPLHFARSAVLELIDQLTTRDRFALVTYASHGEVAIPLSPATPEALGGWRARIAGIAAGGGTHMAHGLDLAHALVAGAQHAGRAPRVILISDGHANQGDHSLSGLRGRAGRAVAHEYVLSSVGVGAGFDETVMSALADAGTGNFYYLPDTARLAGVFADEFASARETLASALEVVIGPGSGVAVESASGYPLERDGETVRFRPGDLAAGQERRIWLGLRAPTGAEAEIPLGEIALTYTDRSGERRHLALPALPKLACVAGEDDYFASFDPAVYKRAIRFDGLGRLQEQVAAKLRAGEQAEAVSQVEGYLEELATEQLRALGYVDAEALAPAESLRDTVVAPAAARPDVQNHLGKQLLEEGRDLRRAGAKQR
jgi:Ca-activated chloride channel family protein